MSVFDIDDLQVNSTIDKIYATLNRYVRYNDNIKNLQILPEDPNWLVVQDKKRETLESKEDAIVISYNILAPWNISYESVKIQESINNKFGFEVYCVIYTKGFGYVPMTEDEHNKWSEYFSECVGVAMKERQGVPKLICTLAKSFFNKPY